MASEPASLGHGGMMRRRSGLYWSAGMVALSMAAPASAQAQAAPPQMAPPTREQVNRLPTTTEATPPSRLTVTGGIERAHCALDEPRFQTVTMTLRDVAFDNLVGVDAADLRPAFAPYLGRTVPIGTICEIRDAASTILRRQGYLAAVEVPPQHIGDGVVHLTVLMAKLVAIHVRGETGRGEKLLGAYLQRLVDGKPFNQNAAERSLLLAGDLPGYDIRLALHPAGATPGEVIGEVSVTRIPIAASLTIQNLGSQAIGRWSAQASAEINDLIGLGDRAVLGSYNTLDTREQSVAQAAYEVRPGTSGLILSGRFTYAWTRPDIGDGDPLRARTLVASGEASYPLVRRQAETIRAAAGLDVIGQKLRFGDAPLTDDQLRMLYGRIDGSFTDAESLRGVGGFTAADPHWRIIGSLEVRKGLGGIGASHDCGPAPLYLRCATAPSLSRLDADPRGAVIRFGGSIELRPIPVLAFVVNPRLQYAFDPLLSYEQYSAGDYTIGRGYDPGALIGDSGAGAQTEVRVGRLNPSGPRSVSIQPFAFFDAAWLWTRGALSSVRDPQRLFSVGGGVRTALGNRARLDLTLAAPVQGTPIPGEHQGLRVLLSLTTRILPWRS
jgi:hemolysin activation/secretion protein